MALYGFRHTHAFLFSCFKSKQLQCGCTVVQQVHMHPLQIIKNIIFLAIFKGFFGLYIISMCVITLRMLQPVKPSGQELLQPPNNLGSTLAHQLHLLCYFTMTSEYLFKWFYKSYPLYGIGGQLFYSFNSLKRLM